jgi:hypothetical protein
LQFVKPLQAVYVMGGEKIKIDGKPAPKMKSYGGAARQICLRREFL